MRKSFVTPPLTKMIYGSWSKWETGYFYGIKRETTEEWSCQICGQKQIIGLPQYFLPFDLRMTEFLRICAGCKADIVKAKIKTYKQLLKEINDFKERRKREVMAVENLTGK